MIILSYAIGPHYPSDTVCHVVSIVGQGNWTDLTGGFWLKPNGQSSVFTEAGYKTPPICLSSNLVKASLKWILLFTQSTVYFSFLRKLMQMKYGIQNAVAHTLLVCNSCKARLIRVTRSGVLTNQPVAMWNVCTSLEQDKPKWSHLRKCTWMVQNAINFTLDESGP